MRVTNSYLAGKRVSEPGSYRHAADEIHETEITEALREESSYTPMTSVAMRMVP
jgi:hypothetical protein